MSEYIEVPKNVIFHSFIEWYTNNVGDIMTHSIMPADRIIVLNAKDENIAYIELYVETRYYIRKDIYELWSNA